MKLDEAWAGRIKFWGPLTYVLVFSIVFGLMHRPAEMGLATATGLLLFAVLHLDKFESFKGAGFEAKMRRAEEAANEAYATIDKLRDLAVSLADPSVVSITMQGRMLQYIPIVGKFEQISEIENALRRLGIDDQTIRSATAFFYDAIERDHHRRILYAMANEADEPLRAQARQHAESLPENFDAARFVADSGWVPGAVTAEAIDDLRHFLSTRTLRRAEQWQ